MTAGSPLTSASILLGPWPLRPLLLTVTIGFFLTALRNGQRIQGGENVSVFWLTDGALGAFAIAMCAGLVLQAGALWQRRFKVNLGGYLAVLSASVGVVIGMRWLLGDVQTSAFSDIPTIAIAFFRILLVLIVIQAIVGRMSERLSLQVDQTQRALEVAERQQGILLTGDEFTRRQISSTLHDRVQARLIAACMQLQMIDIRDPAAAKREIDTVVSNLEEIRSVDVRRVARALSPQLMEVDLESAIEDMAGQYEPAMRTTVRIDPLMEVRSTRPSPQVLLGTYRFVEQALINAAGHGAARECRVDVRVNEQDQIVVTVDDDGRGFQGVPSTTGLGSTLMTTWTRSLGGSWSWRPGPTSGVVVEAILPLPRSQV